MSGDKRVNNGGARKGAGRPKRVDEENAKKLIKTALRQLYSKDEDDDAVVEFLKEFAGTSRGQLFVAEHLLGKPKEIIEQTIVNDEYVDLSKLDLKTLKKLKDIADN